MSQQFDNPDLELEVGDDLPEVIDLDEIVVNRRKFRLGGKVYELQDRKDFSFVESERVQRLLVQYRRIRAEDGNGPNNSLDDEQEARLETVQNELLERITVPPLTADAIGKLDPDQRDRQLNAIVTLFFAEWNRRTVRLEELLGTPRPTTTPSESTPDSSGSTPPSKPGSTSGTAAATSPSGEGFRNLA